MNALRAFPTAVAICAALAAASPALPAAAPRGDDLCVAVRRSADRAPVAAARVSVLETGRAADTDASGLACLGPQAPGRLTLRIVADQYRPLELGTRVPGAASPIEVLIDPAPIRFDEAVIVSADRMEGVGQTTPRVTTVIGRTSIDEWAARTAPELLQDHSGGWVQKTNHGGGSPIVRGLVGNQVLLLIDGIRLNNATYRLGPNQYMNTVDAYSLERVEVVRGSGSVAYGSDALGGVVNMVTPRPVLSPAGLATGGAVSTRLAGRGMEASARVDGFVSGRRAAARGGITYRAFGDLVAGGGLGTESPSGYDEADADASVIWAPAPHTRLTAVVQQVHQFDVPRYDQVAQRGYAEYAFDPQVRRLGYLDVEQRLDGRGLDAVRLTASWQRSEEGRLRRRDGSAVETREQDVVSTAGIAMAVEGRAGRRVAWTSGVEIYHDVVRSWRRDTHLTTGASVALRGLYPDGAERLAIGAFALASVAAGRASVEFGARYARDAVEADDPVFGPTSISPDGVVGSAAVRYAVKPWLGVFGSVSQGFRAPNIDDLSTLGPFDFGVEVPPGELAPERSVTLDGGVKVAAASLVAGASAYRINLRDLIDRERASFNGAPTLDGQDVYRRANLADAYIYGVEADAEWRLRRGLTVSAFASTSVGRQAAADIPLRRIPPANGHLAVRYSWVRGLWLEGSVRLARTQDRLAPGDVADHRIPPGGTPGWVVSNVSFGMPVGRRLTITGGVANVFNEAYRVHGSGVDGPGRHVWTGVRATF